jgi:hypothetical protein
MESYLKLLVLVLAGLLLIWFFFYLHNKQLKKKNLWNEDMFEKLGTEPLNGASDSGQGNGGTPGSGDVIVSGYVPGFGSISRPKYKGTENSGGLMICPICLFKMDSGEMVKTKAFPPLTPDSKDRLMHIQGCVYCMDGKRERICPVCGKTISVKDFLIARIFDRSIRRSHVHVLGCTQCRPLKTM